MRSICLEKFFISIPRLSILINMLKIIHNVYQKRFTRRLHPRALFVKVKTGNLYRVGLHTVPDYFLERLPFCNSFDGLSRPCTLETRAIFHNWGSSSKYSVTFPLIFHECALPSLLTWKGSVLGLKREFIVFKFPHPGWLMT